MSDNYIRLPRSLILDPEYQDLSDFEQRLYTIILTIAAWKPRKFNDFGEIIDIQPGQICISERELEKYFPNKRVTRDHIRYAIKKLVLCGFLTQTFPHTRQLLTVSHKETYELMANNVPPDFSPNCPQLVPTKEEYKELKDIKRKRNNNKESPSDSGQAIDQAPIDSDRQFNITYKDGRENEQTSNKVYKKEINTKQSIAKQILSHFNSSLATHIPDLKASFTETHAKHFLPICEKYDLERIKKVIEFSHTDEFWCSIAINPKKFMKNFDQLLVKATTKPKPRASPGGIDRRPKDQQGNPLPSEYAGLWGS